MSDAMTGGKASSLLNELANSRLLTDDRLSELRGEAERAGNMSAQELGRIIIEKGWLSDVQVQAAIDRAASGSADGFEEIVKKSGEIGVPMGTNMPDSEAIAEEGGEVEEFRRVVRESGEIGVPLVSRLTDSVEGTNAAVKELSQLVRESEEAPAPLQLARFRGKRSNLLLMWWAIAGVTLLLIVIFKPSASGVDKLAILEIPSWKEVDRKGGRIEIDGVPTEMPVGEPMTLRLMAGTRKLKLSRVGFVPYETTLNLAHNEFKRLEVTWQPVSTSDQPQSGPTTVP